MCAQIVGIYRYPVKGFTAEPLAHADLAPGEGFPHDRVYAVENGPSGFDPAAPVFTPKQKFTVLASLPRVAAARTAYDARTTELRAEAPGQPAFRGRLGDACGREAFAAWLAGLLGEAARGPLKVFEAPREFRFTDHPQGQLSILNLASLRDLETRLARPLDPLRFRANLHVEGWPPWAENAWAGCALSLGGAAGQVFKPIVRCAAVNVDLETAERDLDLTRALFDNFGHMHFGVYARVTAAGRVAAGDPISTPAAVAAGKDAQWA